MGYQILGVVMKDEKHARYHIKLNSGFALKKGCKTSTSTSGLTSVSLNKTLADLLLEFGQNFKEKNTKTHVFELASS